MELVQNQNAKSFKFYPATGSKKAFVSIPRKMVKDADVIDKDLNTEWHRLVAFGQMAQVCKQLYDDGCRLFDVAKGRIRDNSFEGDEGDTIARADIICMELAGSTAKKLMKKLEPTTPTKKPPKA